MVKEGTVAKSAIWYTASNLLVKGIGFFTVPLFTRLLTQAQFGEYNNFLSWLSVMTIVVSASLESTIVSAKKDYADNFDEYAMSIMCLSVLSAAAWLGAAFLFTDYFSELFLIDRAYVIGMFLYLLFFPTVTIFQTWERFRYRYHLTVLISVLLSVGIAAFSLGFAVLLPNALDGVILGRILPVICIGLAVLIYFAIRVKRVSVEHWKYALPITLPYIPHLLSMTLLGSMGKILIVRYWGEEANALYSLAFSCGLIVSIFLTSLNGAFAPWLVDKLNDGNHEMIRKASRPYVGLFSLFAISGSLFAPEALYLLGGEEYIEAAAVMPPIALGCVYQFAYCLFVNVEQYEKRTIGMAVASVSAAVLNWCLGMVLIPRFGYIAAGYATALSYLWLFIVHMLLVKKMGMLHIYDMRFIGLCMAACTIAMALVSALYSATMFRWMLAAVLLVVGLIQGRELRRNW